MLFRLIRIAPLAAAGWRMYQNRKRRTSDQGGQTGQGSSTPPPQTYR